MHMKKVFFLTLSLWLYMHGNAQVKSATLQASGLTCALCAKSVFKNLQTLPFIQEIDTDLEGSSFLLAFKPGQVVDADLIRKMVEDAGFSVAGLKLVVHFDAQPIRNDQHVTVNGKVYHFLKVTEQVLSGETTLILVDKPFLSAREYKKFANATDMECFKTGQAGKCCTEKGVVADTRIYHVSM